MSASKQIFPTWMRRPDQVFERFKQYNGKLSEMRVSYNEAIDAHTNLLTIHKSLRLSMIKLVKSNKKLTEKVDSFRARTQSMYDIKDEIIEEVDPDEIVVPVEDERSMIGADESSFR